MFIVSLNLFLFLIIPVRILLTVYLTEPHLVVYQGFQLGVPLSVNMRKMEGEEMLLLFSHPLT